MVAAVAAALSAPGHLLVQAGTGTGKTLGYLVPVLAARRRAVVTTATRALGDQLVRVDLPLLQEAGSAAGLPPVDYALLKGRSNYVCRLRLAEVVELAQRAPESERVADPLLFDPGADELAAGPEEPQARARRGPDVPGRGGGRLRPEEVRSFPALVSWAETTETGERGDAPGVTDRVWAQVSMDSAGCPGAAACPYGGSCFAERARARAREASLVVTNHALVAQDLGSGGGMLGEFDVLVVDEVHALPGVLTQAWGHTVAPRGLARVAAAASSALGARAAGRRTRVTGGATAAGTTPAEQNRLAAHEATADLDALDEQLARMLPGLCPDLPEAVANLLVALAARFDQLARELADAGEADASGPRAVAARRSLAGRLREAVDSLETVATGGPQWVRWVEMSPAGDPHLRVAPLEVGTRLAAALGEVTLVGTSATVAVGGSFEPICQALGLLGAAKPGQTAGEPGARAEQAADEHAADERAADDHAADEHAADEHAGGSDARAVRTVDVGTPFDFARQAMLYVPGPGFPEPVGRERAAHSAAVLDELVELVRAAGGRTLALFTTTAAARRAAGYLTERVHTRVLGIDEADAGSLAQAFGREETATLCATMGFWQGIDVVGPSLSCVVIDKIPFPPVDDPLTSARRAAADAAGRDGFAEVYLATAAITLAQGVGRLIRAPTDRGVVAILDPRLVTRGYGRVLRASLPAMRVFRDRPVVLAALTRLTGGVR